MYHYKTLENTKTETLYHTFLNAFSDYAVPMDMPFEVFEKMLVRRGYEPECSVGAFEDESQEMVGFILNGRRQWEGKLTAYDLGTGVVPNHRKRGISKTIFKEMIDVLKEKGTEQYLLEVIKGNEAAFSLYQKQGLNIVRSFNVYRAEKPCSDLAESEAEIIFHKNGNEINWDMLQSFWDYPPSWQNYSDSVEAVIEDFLIATAKLDGETVGYGIMDKRSGDCPQIAVKKEYRRRGVAGNIFKELSNKTESEKVSVTNVDDRCETLKHFLERYGFENYCEQYEMMLIL